MEVREFKGAEVVARSSVSSLATTFFRILRAPEIAKQLVNYRFQKFRPQKLVNYCFQEFQVGSAGDSYFH